MLGLLSITTGPLSIDNSHRWALGYDMQGYNAARAGYNCNHVGYNTGPYWAWSIANRAVVN